MGRGYRNRPVWNKAHDSQVAAWLTIMGYDVYDLKLGTNGLIYDQMTHHKWPGAENGPAGFDTVTD